MKTHMRIHEKGGAPSARKLISCDMCGKKVQYYNMKRHRKIVHGMEPALPDPREVKKSKQRVLSCTICDKKILLFNMKRHMKLVHKVEGTAKPGEA